VLEETRNARGLIGNTDQITYDVIAFAFERNSDPKITNQH